eukprot:COSAG01_NODE_53896_length_336_cov_0.438819_1_plen_33_part_10
MHLCTILAASRCADLYSALDRVEVCVRLHLYHN